MKSKTLLLASVMVFVGGTAFAEELTDSSVWPGYSGYTAHDQQPIFTWAGPYLGAQVGYMWGHPSSELVEAGFGAIQHDSLSASGVIGGGHVGYNCQVSKLVIGVEGDINGTSYSGNSSDNRFSIKRTVDGSIRGRLGYALDRTLIYATGGLALKPTRQFFHTGLGEDSSYTTSAGWTVGAGVEYALTENWSVRAEYRYTDFGQADLALVNSEPVGSGPFTYQIREADQRVQVGVSYKFDVLLPSAPLVHQ